MNGENTTPAVVTTITSDAPEPDPSRLRKFSLSLKKKTIETDEFRDIVNLTNSIRVRVIDLQGSKHRYLVDPQVPLARLLDVHAFRPEVRKLSNTHTAESDGGRGLTFFAVKKKLKDEDTPAAVSRGKWANFDETTNMDVADFWHTSWAGMI